MKQPLLVAARWILALTLIVSAYFMGAGESTKEAAGFNAVMPLLYSMALLIGGVLCIAPELMHWGSIPIRIFFENLLYPSERETPPPDYTLTRLYCEQERYDEALEQYQQILGNHPQELLAYVEAIELAIEIEQPEVADKIYRKGVSKIRAPEARAHLAKIYEEAKARPREEAPEEEEELQADESGERRDF